MGSIVNYRTMLPGNLVPQNAIYLQAAFAITVVALAVYVAYALLRLRQAQDELRMAREQRDNAPAPRATAADDGSP